MVLYSVYNAHPLKLYTDSLSCTQTRSIKICCFPCLVNKQEADMKCLVNKQKADMKCLVNKQEADMKCLTEELVVMFSITD